MRRPKIVRVVQLRGEQSPEGIAGVMEALGRSFDLSMAFFSPVAGGIDDTVDGGSDPEGLLDVEVSVNVEASVDVEAVVERSASQERIAGLVGDYFEESDFPLCVAASAKYPFLFSFDVSWADAAAEYLMEKAAEVEVNPDESDFNYLFRLLREFYNEPEDAAAPEAFQERVVGMNAWVVQQPIAFSEEEAGFPVYSNDEMCAELLTCAYGPLMEKLGLVEESLVSNQDVLPELDAWSALGVLWRRFEQLLEMMQRKMGEDANLESAYEYEYSLGKAVWTKHQERSEKMKREQESAHTPLPRPMSALSTPTSALSSPVSVPSPGLGAPGFFASVGPCGGLAPIPGSPRKNAVPLRKLDRATKRGASPAVFEVRGGVIDGEGHKKVKRFK